LSFRGACTANRWVESLLTIEGHVVLLLHTCVPAAHVRHATSSLLTCPVVFFVCLSTCSYSSSILHHISSTPLFWDTTYSSSFSIILTSIIIYCFQLSFIPTIDTTTLYRYRHHIFIASSSLHRYGGGHAQYSKYKAGFASSCLARRKIRAGVATSSVFVAASIAISRRTTKASAITPRSNATTVPLLSRTSALVSYQSSIGNIATTVCI